MTRTTRSKGADMDEEAVRQLVVRFTDRVRQLIAQAVTELRRLTAPVLAAWARFAIERWERVREFFGAHPDLAETDRWLDAWYSFGTA